MTTLSRTIGRLAALAAAAMLGGCAGHGQGMQGMQGMHGMHSMHGGGAGAAGCPMHAETQQKMAAAATPQERQALMAEHHKSMGMGMGMGMAAGDAGAMQCPMMQPAAK